jgi:hypothetical protein
LAVTDIGLEIVDHFAVHIGKCMCSADCIRALATLVAMASVVAPSAEDLAIYNKPVPATIILFMGLS